MKTFFLVLYLIPPLYLIYAIAVYFKTRVPYVGTSKKYVSAIVHYVPITNEMAVYDLGCGKGNFLFAAERYRPKSLIGYELSPYLVLHAKAKAWIMRSNVRVHLQDMFSVDITEADLIYLYLVPPVLNKLWKKIQKEGKRGATILTLADQIDGLPAEQTIVLEPNNPKSRKVFVYRLH
ncbi:MAG: class I SAM-dependent methyltransferase [Parcubacteria group bacterium]